VTVPNHLFLDPNSDSMLRPDPQFFKHFSCDCVCVGIPLWG